MTRDRAKIETVTDIESFVASGRRAQDAVDRATAMTVTEAAREVGVSRQSVHRLIERGHIRVVANDETFPGGRFLLDRGSVTGYRIFKEKKNDA